jgi:hypothetical protein
VSERQRPAVFALESQPAWGLGIVLEERPDKWVLLFEGGGRRIFDKRLAKGLHPVEMGLEEARTLDAKLRGRRLPAVGAAGKTGGVKKSAPRRTPTYASFEEQVRWFEAFFAGGFQGERFIAEERGHPESKGKNGYKQAAIALARERLSQERFAAGDVEELFEGAHKVLLFTQIIHPMEGTIAFGSMKAEDRAPFVHALGELLHGEGDYGARFERFIAAVCISDAKGKAKKVTWPMATLLPALYRPEEYVCVKPTCFEQQAPLVGLSVSRSATLNGTNHALFLEVARATEKRLHEAGLQPRDLMDVYSFIWRSQAAKPAA